MNSEKNDTSKWIKTLNSELITIREYTSGLAKFSGSWFRIGGLFGVYTAYDFSNPSNTDPDKILLSAFIYVLGNGMVDYTNRCRISELEKKLEEKKSN